MEEELETPITFSQYPQCSCYILKLREKINAAIEENLK